jgi:hypothetical protein
VQKLCGRNPGWRQPTSSLLEETGEARHLMWHKELESQTPSLEAKPRLETEARANIDGGLEEVCWIRMTVLSHLNISFNCLLSRSDFRISYEKVRYISILNFALSDSHISQVSILKSQELILNINAIILDKTDLDHGIDGRYHYRCSRDLFPFLKSSLRLPISYEGPKISILRKILEPCISSAQSSIMKALRPPGSWLLNTEIWGVGCVVRWCR